MSHAEFGVSAIVSRVWQIWFSQAWLVKEGCTTFGRTSFLWQKGKQGHVSSEEGIVQVSCRLKGI